MGLGAVVCWAVSPVTVRMLSGSFTVAAQAFWRYLFSLALLWISSAIMLGPRAFASSVRGLGPRLPKLLLVAAANFAFQFCFNIALYRLHAGLAALLNQSTVLFGALFAAVFFADERQVLRRPAFAAGLLMALAGVAITIIGQRGLSPAQLGVGVLAMVSASASWALMGALVRLWLSDVPPTVAVSAVFTIVTPAFLLAALVGGVGGLVPAAGARTWLLLAASSLAGLGIAYPLYYAALPRLGLALSSGIGLLIPLLVSVFSALVLKERLSWLQLGGALLLLPGCWLIIRARFRVPSARP